MFKKLRNGTLDIVTFPVLYSDRWAGGNAVSAASPCFRNFFFATAHPEKLDSYTTLAEPFSASMWIASSAAIVAAFAVLASGKAAGKIAKCF